MTTFCVPVDTVLTDRQRRELEYHCDHAAEYQKILQEPFPCDVLRPSQRRWWNAYWDMYTYLLSLDLRAKRCLVVGCGFGSDALYLAKMDRALLTVLRPIAHLLGGRVFLVGRVSKTLA
jgi:hypothetical protein